MHYFRYLFDIRSLSLINGMISFTLVVCMLYTLSSQKVYPGFRKWTVATVFNAAGFTVLSLRGLVPDFLSIIGTNILLISAYFLISRGLTEFVGKKQNNIKDSITAMLFLILLLFYTYIKPDISMRIIFFSVFSGYFCMKSAIVIYTQSKVCIGKTNWLLLTGFMIICFWFFLRSVITFMSGREIADFMSADIFQGTIFIIGFISHIIIITGLIIMNSQRLDFELRKANDNIKSLKSLLPVCASCKKIRDDRGYWNQIESYIKTHTEADFSHGLCPECTKKLYPEIDDFK